MKNNKRIAVNTGYIYIRLIITLFISLFSTKYVLIALGEENYGLYNVIAGVVALFTFISTTMATTTQRFISFSMGKYNDCEKVKEIIYNSIVLHLLVAIVVTIIVELGGLWAINNLLSIPEVKIQDAKFVLFTVSIGLFATILTVPLEAVLMARENILFISLTSTINSVFKFLVAIFLLYLLTNRLKLYAILMALICLFNLIVDWIYCYKKYPETRVSVHPIKEFSIIKNIGSFAGWVMIGTTCSTIRQQGSSILLNMFFGVVINAATGIATQVYGVLMQFSSSIVNAIRPQLVKSAGSNDFKRMSTLTYAVCKYPLMLTGLTAIPLIVMMPYILKIWLDDVPEYTSTFCQLLLVNAIINQSTIGLTISLEAYGKVKLIHSIIGLSFLLVLPIGYCFLKRGFSPTIIYLCIVINELFAAILRIILSKRLVGLKIKDFILKVIKPFFNVVVPVIIIDYGLWCFLSHNIYYCILNILISVLLFAFLAFNFGLSQAEKLSVKKYLNKTHLKFLSLH